MADKPSLPAPTPEQRRVAAGQYDRANQVINTGNFDYGIKLLTSCCKLDPANLIYRKALRVTQRAKYKNNMKGSRFAGVTTAAAKLRLKGALGEKDYPRVLEVAEEIFSANPWDVGTQLAVAQAFAACGQLGAAVWSLEQAYQKSPEDIRVNKALARLYEKTGHFTEAHALWAWVRKHHPADQEAFDKVKDLAANETIARGNYEKVLGQTQAGEGPAETQPHAALEGTEEAPALRAGPREQKLAALRERIEAAPQDAAGYLQLAAEYRRLDQWDKVREALEEGLAAVGSHFQISSELAEANVQPYRQNLAVVEAKLRQKPGDIELEKLKFQLTTEINRRELDIYRQRAERFPTEMNYRLELGIRLLQANQTDGAIQELQAARSDPRLHWRALMYLGFCFQARRNWRLAQRNFEDALRNLPPGETAPRKEILFHLAQGCAGAGDLAAAVDWAYELANEDFGYKNIGRLIDEWQARLAKVGEDHP